MHRLAVPLVLLICAFTASVAEAAGVVGARVNPDPNAVRKFWTPARINAAKPMDIQRPLAKPGGAGSTVGAAVKVIWPATADQTYTNGKVYFADGSALYVCSGTAVASINSSVVLTAGHCVADGGGNRFYSNWFFRPAYNNGFRTYPDFYAGHLYTTRDWAANREFGKDVGAAVVGTVGTPAQTLLERLAVPGRGVTFSPDYTIGTSHKIDAFGYPAAGKFNGQSLYHCDSYVSRIDSADPNTMGIPCSMTGGSSGGAWLDSSKNQVSVNSYGYASLKNVMFGPVFGVDAEAVYRAAEQTTPSSSSTPSGSTVG